MVELLGSDEQVGSSEVTRLAGDGVIVAGS